MLRPTGRRQPFRQQANKGQPLPPEANPWWWHPGRVGVPSGPPSFLAELEKVDPTLTVTYNNYAKQYQIWMRAPRFQNKVCWGWKLLFNEKVLGPHTFARLYDASVDKWGSAKYYFDAIQREMERDKEKQDKKNLADVIDQSMEVFDHSQIKVGYGPSNGSKFSTYHS